MPSSVDLHEPRRTPCGLPGLPTASTQRRQGCWWILTIPKERWSPTLPGSCTYVKGQGEIGGNTNYEHWQVCVHFAEKTSLAGVKRVFGDGIHAELTKSKAALDYVWKDDTRIDGTQFEFGVLPVKRNDARDWDGIWESAVNGRFSDVPAQIRICHYRSLQSIFAANCKPAFTARTVVVYWGTTGSGKSYQAWSEAGVGAYPKDPLTKWWTGYTGQRNVVIDEFRGIVSIANALRWFDGYPLLLETKGASVPAAYTKVWITSNIHPKQWYPDLDHETWLALRRRLKIMHFDSHNPFCPRPENDRDFEE